MFSLLENSTLAADDVVASSVVVKVFASAASSAPLTASRAAVWRVH
jgi:hypothetical protein